MIKFITILYNNDKEIKLLFSSIEKVISEFQLVISLNSKLKDKIHDQRVIYVGNELNIGFGKAINRSTKYIDKDDVLCILNSDVRFDKLDVNKIRTLLSKNYIIGPSCFNKYNEKQDTFRKDITLIRIINRVIRRVFLLNRKSLPFEYDSDGDFFVDWVVGGIMFIKGGDFLNVNGFNKMYFMYLEDIDFCIRARKKGLKVLYANSIKCFYEADRKSLNITSLKRLKLFLFHLQSFFIYAISHPIIFFKFDFEKHHNR